MSKQTTTPKLSPREKQSLEELKDFLETTQKTVRARKVQLKSLKDAKLRMLESY